MGSRRQGQHPTCQARVTHGGFSVTDWEKRQAPPGGRKVQRTESGLGLGSLHEGPLPTPPAPSDMPPYVGWHLRRLPSPGPLSPLSGAPSSQAPVQRDLHSTVAPGTHPPAHLPGSHLPHRPLVPEDPLPASRLGLSALTHTRSHTWSWKHSEGSAPEEGRTPPSAPSQRWLLPRTT